MKHAVKLVGYVVCMGIAFLLISCGGGGDGDGSTTGLEAVTSASLAEFMVEAVAEDVVQQSILSSLNNGTFSNTVVNCATGTATVTGFEDYSGNVSCGSTCNSTTYEAQVYITFNGCTVNYGNGAYTLTGDVGYYEYNYSQQSGLSYYSSESYEVGTYSSPVSVKIVYDNSWGYQDSIEFYGSSNDSPALMSGWCMGGNGIAYSF